MTFLLLVVAARGVDHHLRSATLDFRDLAGPELSREAEAREVSYAETARTLEGMRSRLDRKRRMLVTLGGSGSPSLLEKGTEGLLANSSDFTSVDASLAKLAAEARGAMRQRQALPSSFAEFGAKLVQFEQRAQTGFSLASERELASLESQSAGPSSLLQEGKLSTGDDLKELRARAALFRRVREMGHRTVEDAESGLAPYASLVQEQDRDDRLKALEDKIAAELGKWPPMTSSSFLESEGDDAFAEVDAKLRSIEEKTKAELAKLNVPSSFLETEGDDAFADLDAKLRSIEEKTKAELAKLNVPSSFLETLGDDGFASLDAKLQAIEAKTKSELAKLTAESGASSFLEHEPSSGSLDWQLHHLDEKTQEYGLTDLNDHVKTLESTTKHWQDQVAKLDTPSSPPSLLQQDKPSEFADLDSRLKAFKQKMAVGLETIEPSSLLERYDRPGYLTRAAETIKKVELMADSDLDTMSADRDENENLPAAP